jgi:hypothetical protein
MLFSHAFDGGIFRVGWVAGGMGGRRVRYGRMGERREK